MSSKNVVDLRNRGRKPEREEPVRRRAPVQSEEFSQETPRMRFVERNAALRARRRKRWVITIVIVLVVIGGAAYGISWVSYLPNYSITQVTVAGTQQVPQQLVYDYIETQLAVHGHPFFSPDNVLRFNAGALEREIVGYFPRIASAQVTRASLFATAITVQVTERQPFALWCTDDTQTDCYYLDQGGFIFLQAPSSGPTIAAGSQSDASTTPESATSSAPTASAGANGNNMYVFEGAIATSSSPIGQTFVGAHLPGILAFLDALGQAGLAPEGTTIVNDADFDVALAQGFYLKASFGEDPQQLVQNLQLVLTSDSLQNNLASLEYVDLRFGDRVYYKLKGEDQAQAPSTSQPSQ